MLLGSGLLQMDHWSSLLLIIFQCHLVQKDMLMLWSKRFMCGERG